MTALPSTEDLARLAKAITPGPWKAGYTDTHIVGRNARGVCSTGGYNDTRLPQEQTVAENAANAEAIALLPALIREVLDRREADAISQAARDVLAERQRQVSAEGWDDINDDCNDRAELAQAAACYALSGTPADEAVFIHGRWKDPRDLFWPWDRAWWKPTNRRRDLDKAGALILAEIERLDRATPTTEASHGE